VLPPRHTDSLPPVFQVWNTRGRVGKAGGHGLA
jgi:hypothetical protein